MEYFDEVNSRVEALRFVCSEHLGSREIADISVDEPVPPLDELYFRKAVLWCFVLLRETGPFIRFSGKLLRSSPTAHEKFRSTKKLIECARTVHAHNLRSEKEYDKRTLRTYEIWLYSNGGEPVDWEKSSSALLEAMNDILSDIEHEWSRRCEDPGDRQALWLEYEREKQTYWEAHEFDPFVAAAAEEVGLEEFDGAVFRKEGDRVERWRRLVSCFETRAAAESAIDRAIRVELRSVFGVAP